MRVHINNMYVCSKYDDFDRMNLTDVNEICKLRESISP